MNEEMFQWLKEFAPKAWDLAVRQVWIDALEITAAFGFFLSIFILVLLRGRWKSFDEITFASLAVLGVFGFIFALLFFFEALPRMLNPEFYALMELKP